MRGDACESLRRLLAAVGTRRWFLGGLNAAMLAMTSDPALAAKRRRKKPRRKQGGKNGSDGRCKRRHSEQEILRFISKAARKYGQSGNAMERVARCESALDPCAVNRSGPYYGLFQFLKSTWKTTPYKNRSIWDPEAQALATAWMWKQGRKNEWACQ